MQGHFSSRVSTGYWQFLRNLTWAQGKFLKEEFAAFPIGEGAGWSSTHSSRCGIGFWEMQHSLKACPRLCERRTARPRGSFGLVQRAYPGPPFGGCQGNVRFPSPPTPSPPPYDSHFPPQTHKWSMRFPTSRPVSRFVASCQKPGDVSPQASSLSKSRCFRSASTSTPSG